MASQPRRAAAPNRALVVTKQEFVYRTIRERIASGAFPPGHRIVIDALAEELEVSGLPVREAIRRLEAEGVVIHRPNVGAQVTPTDPAGFAEELTVLAVLEGYATSLAAPCLGAAALARLGQINDEMAAAAAALDTLGFGRLNHEFHGLIYEHCPSAALVGMLGEVEHRLDAIRRTVFVQIPHRAAASVSEHEQLMALIAAGAPAETIERSAREHKLATLESARAFAENAPALSGRRPAAAPRKPGGRPPQLERTT